MAEHTKAHLLLTVFLAGGHTACESTIGITVWQYVKAVETSNEGAFRGSIREVNTVASTQRLGKP